MRRSKTLSKIRAGKSARVCGLGHFIPPLVKHASHFGYDCIWLDLEHRAMEQRESQALLAFSHLFDIDIMVRAPTMDQIRLYRYLEDGASGLMIPLLSTPEQAADVVNAVKFPPLGSRGLDAAGLEVDFILGGGPDFPAESNRETFLVVQIETPEALDNVDEIAAVEGVEALFVGPADLGLRLKHSGSSLSVEDATKKVAEAAARHGKTWGRPAGTSEQARQFHDMGARLIVYGGDFGAILNGLESCSKQLDEVIGT